MSNNPIKRRWIVLALISCGAVVRIIHLFSIPFDAPFHLGGLFYEFSRQILLNHFALPETIPFYSLGGIPFAYPPLGFYLQAIVMEFFPSSLFLTVNLLPPLISVATLPAFLWMIKAQSEDDLLRMAALFAFAFMPGAFINQIEAAGLADACGTLAIILYLGGLFRFETDPRPGRALVAGIFLGLCVLSSPGSAFGGAIVSILFLIKVLRQDFKQGSFTGSTWLLLTGITGLAISAPYWMTVLRTHEFGGLSTAFLSQQNTNALFNQIRYVITFKPADMLTFIGEEGVYGFLFDWLIFAGLIWALLNKKGFQVFLFFVLWMIPREGSWLVAIPAAWLAALGMVHIVRPLFQKAFNSEVAEPRLPLAPGLLGMVLVILIIASAMIAVYDLRTQADMVINASMVETLQQEQQKIPPGAHVLVAGNTALREWTPALLEREVLNCEFGLEWQPEESGFVHRINQALASGDLVLAMAVVHEYSGDDSVWLVGDPNRVEKLTENTSPLLDITIQDQSSELILIIISTRETSWTDHYSRSSQP